MVEPFNKFVLKMLDGKEYSLGLRLKIKDIKTSKVSNSNDFNVVYFIELINEDDVPYELNVIKENVRGEIEDLTKYMSLQNFDMDILIDVEYDPDYIEGKKYLYLSKSFKKVLYEKLSSINTFEVDEETTLHGKFLPRIDVQDTGMNDEISFYFLAKDISQEEKPIIEEILDDVLNFIGGELATILRNALTESMDLWSRNFHLDSPDLGLGDYYFSEYYQWKVKLV